MIESIQESYITQIQEQGRIAANMDIRYIASLDFTDTNEGSLFWSIIIISYLLHGVYDYGTLIKLYIMFDSVPNRNINIYYIYSICFDMEKGTLTSVGFEYLLEKIGNAE